MGCRNPYCMHSRNKSRNWANGVHFCVSFVDEIIKTPEPYWVRRVANILNKHTIHTDCFEPPDHSNLFGGFCFFANKTKEKELNK